MSEDVDPLAALTAALGRRPPEALAALPRAALEDLGHAVHEAREIQARQLLEALDGALKVAPRPLRSLLKRLLLG
jgi:hypothetical protein